MYYASEARDQPREFASGQSCMPLQGRIVAQWQAVGLFWQRCSGCSNIILPGFNLGRRSIAGRTCGRWTVSRIAPSWVGTIAVV